MSLRLLLRNYESVTKVVFDFPTLLTDFSSKRGVCHKCSQFSKVSNHFNRRLLSLRHLSTTSSRCQKARVNAGVRDHTSTVMYIAAAGIAMLGGAYAGVPLYRMFCAATGLGGQSSIAHDTSGKIESLEAVDDRTITIRFNADVASSMQWNFKPQQSEIKVFPGETALAFYTARNPTAKPIVGISTYSVVPFDAGQYFNKIQCFCFEEQILNPDEEVDMPVFFYIDPEYVTDPKLEDINEITLSYTFFEAKEGMSLPLPGYAKPH